MLPREFQSAYGRPIPRRHSVTFGTSLIIPPNEDRYLIIFWAGSNTFFITPSGSTDDQLDRLSGQTSILPLVFTHQLHGSMVNLGWRIDSPGGTITVTIIEGFMKPIGERRSPRAKN